MKYTHDDGKNKSELERIGGNTPTGIKIETGFCDDVAESKHFSGEVNVFEAPAVACTVQIRIGYDLDDCRYPHDYVSMTEKQAAFDRDSMLYTVSSLDDFRHAVLDGAIVAEQKRIEYGDALIASFETPYRPRTKKCWDWIKLDKNNRPPVHVFLSIPRPGRRDDRLFILGDEVLDRTPWHWYGFKIDKINWERLYNQLLKTARHYKNIMALCNAISGAIA